MRKFVLLRGTSLFREILNTKYQILNTNHGCALFSRHTRYDMRHTKYACPVANRPLPLFAVGNRERRNMIYAIRNTTYDIRHTTYDIRHTTYDILSAFAPLHLSRVLYKFAPFYAKQTQFAGYSNERKVFYNNEL